MLFRLAIPLAVAAMPAAVQNANYGTQKAYEYALRCFVAGGVAMPKPQDDPSGAQTTTIRDRARKAFDTVYYMGRKLGYSESRISNDLDHAKAVEMRLLVSSAAYFARTKADCVKLGLM